MGLFGNETHTFRRPRVQRGTFRQHFSPFSLPKGARQNDVRMNGTLRQRNPHYSSPESTARHAWATPTPIFVARGCSAARLGNTVAHFRCPRVRHDTFRRHFRPFLLPVGVGQNDVRMKGLFGNETHTFRRPRVQHDTLGQHCRAFSLPKSAARHVQATLQPIFVAERCKAE